MCCVTVCLLRVCEGCVWVYVYVLVSCVRA